MQKKTEVGRKLMIAVAVIGVFSLGLGFGNGTIALRRSVDLPEAQKGVAKNLPSDLDYQSVEEVYDLLKKDFDGDLTSDTLLDGLKRGLATASGDDYTEYLSAKDAKEFDQDLQGTFSGIGAELGKDKQAIVVVSPIDGYPAQKAGLRPKDIISEINGKNALDITISEAVNKIRGPVGTKVKLTIIRGEQELKFEITRQQISIPSVESDILKDGRIGYMRIARFDEETGDLAAKAAEKFKRAGVRGVILDLRSNPGGLLEASVDVSGLWLAPGKTVLMEKRDGMTVQTYESEGPAILAKIPTVVLIDDGSASASEIMAGALRDNGAATLMGQQSFGKGSVQTIERLPDGSALKVTIGRWFTPKDKNIDKEGIKPDKAIKETVADIKAGRDPQKAAALKFLQK